MKKIKFYSAIITANLVTLFIKLFTTTSATSLPGLISLKLCPDFIKMAQKYCKDGVITITGTNGKTTTAGLFAHILQDHGKKVLHNEKGANMLSGIASVLALGVGFHRKSNYFVLESDEAYLEKLYDYLHSDYLLVTNLFRDQLDRYGELDTTFKKIQQAIDKNPDLKVVLNADDPMVASLAPKNNRIYFGFDSIEFMFETVDTKAPAESVTCLNCDSNLLYNARYYAHLGNYHCECGYKRAELNYKAQAKIFQDYSIINLNYDGKELSFKVNLPGLYNVYNALAAISMALELKIPADTIQKALKSYQSVFGRAENLVLKNKKVLVQLIKNPVGASEVLRLIGDNKESKLLIMLNDNYADGRDVSWIWDANFEILQNYKQKIVVSGERAYDMALRLKYAGVDEKQITIEKDIKKAIDKSLNLTAQNETLLILPTYTALLKMQNILKYPKFIDFK